MSWRLSKYIFSVYRTLNAVMIGSGEGTEGLKGEKKNAYSTVL